MTNSAGLIHPIRLRDNYQKDAELLGQVEVSDVENTRGTEHSHLLGRPNSSYAAHSLLETH